MLSPNLPSFWPDRSRSRLINTKNAHWHVVEFNESSAPDPPTILLLHGTASSSHSWHGLAPLLAEKMRVVCPDLPNHHLTRVCRGSDMSLESMAGLLREFLEAEDIAPQFIAGHSAGAAIGLNLALQLPQTPDAVISIAGALRPYGGILSPLFSATARLMSNAPGLAKVAAFRADSPRAVRRLVDQTGSKLDDLGYRCMRHLLKDPDHIKNVLRMMGDWDLSRLERQGRSLPFKLLVLEMSRDTAVPAGQAKELLAANSTAKIVRLAGLGHLGHEEAPDVVAAALLDFLAEGATFAH